MMTDKTDVKYNYKGITDTRSTGNRQRKKTLTWIVIVLTVFNVALMLAVLTTTFLTVDEAGARRSEKSGAAMTCVSCQHLREGLYDDETREMDRFAKHSGKDGVEMCCTKTAEDVSVVLSLLLERNLRLERAKGSFMVEKLIRVDGENNTHSVSSAKPAAHLLGFHGEGFYSNREPRENKLQSFNDWDHNNETFLVNGVGFKDGHLIISDAGLYYVYSQVYFKKPPSPNYRSANADSFGTHTISHAVYRYNNRYPHTGEEKLLENSQSLCERTLVDKSEHTSYLGAVLNLRNGDEVFVKVSDLDSIINEAKSNYFGLYLV